MKEKNTDITQSAGLQAKLQCPYGITSFGPAFDGALSLFMETTGSDLLSNLSEIAAPRLMERLEDIYFTKVAASAESVFSLSPRHVALWKSQQGMVGIKHIHNLVRDTLLDVCFRSGISAGNEVDISLRDGRDRPLRPADLLLYAWDRGWDVYVDLTGSSPLTRSGMLDFVPGQVVAEAAKCKGVKYRDLCAAKGYGFCRIACKINHLLITEYTVGYSLVK
ncbi:hypothetical protein OROMI_017743 [Orobanche minor]